MKLKQRVTLGIGLVVMGLVVFLLPTFLDTPTHLDGVFVPAHQQEETALDPDDLRGAGVVDDIKGHLNVFRKDLDVSNNKDKSEDDDKSRVSLRLPLNLTETELLEFILHDNTISSHADKLIQIAHVLEKWRGGKGRTRGVIPANLTKEFVPDKGDIVMPGGIYHDLDFKYDWERRKIPQKVELTGVAVKELGRIVEKMSASHNKKKGRRKAAKMKIYNDSGKNLSAWQRWHNSITQFQLYPGEDAPHVVDAVLDDMRKLALAELYQHEGGTQLKIVYYLENDGRAMFKPMRYPRDVETLPDHFYFSDYERHTAEIAAFVLDRVPREQDTLPDHFYFVDFERHNAEVAAFHLDRVLGFHRVPPTTGRLINVTHDVKRMADSKLLKTFFVSPAGNVCFYGHCEYYCDDDTAFCGHPEMTEGAMAAYLPSERLSARLEWEHPWSRSYHKRKKAEWETNNNYCYHVRDSPPYNTGRRLLDLMDMAAFDFLQGNLDRHHYETFEDFGNYTFTLHLDNGRGFGKSLEDDLSILAPVYQCCLFRYSTLRKLWRFYEGPQHLSDVMRASLATDPVAPVLLERHLLALDRRLKIILKTIYKCVDKNGSHKVIIDDGF